MYKNKQYVKEETMKSQRKRLLPILALVAMLFCTMSLPVFAEGNQEYRAHAHTLVKVPGTYLGSCDECGTSVYVYKCYCGYMIPKCENGHHQ